LLKLERRGTFPGLLKATMIHVDVDRAPPYETISYTWGRTAANHLIIIDGSKLFVNLELMVLLVASTSVTEERLIWVDYICINQSNNFEKSQQIPIMRAARLENGNFS